MASRNRPRAAAEELVDADHELTFERVCAIDVAKDFGKVCIRARRDSKGRRLSDVRDVDARIDTVDALAQELLALRIEKVTLESTSDYWRIWYYLFESAGLSVQVVNARDVKNVPGRPKTDKLDAVWLAKLTEKGMLRPSFVPPAPIRALRDYTRLRTVLVAERTRHWQRLEKLLEDALVKVSSVASSLDTVSVRHMVEALIAGERDPDTLAGMALGKMKAKRHALVRALDGRFDDHHAELARVILDQINSLTTKIDQLSRSINQRLSDIKLPDPDPDPDPDGGGGGGGGEGRQTALSLADRLTEIPGIGPDIAQVLISELGVDPTQWPDSDHLVSWARLSPQTIQSGNKHRTGKAGKGNRYLKGALGQAAASAGRTNTRLGARYQRLVRRRGKAKAQVALARTILVIVYHLMSDPTAHYTDLGFDYYTRRADTERQKRHHINQLQALGFTVVIEKTVA